MEKPTLQQAGVFVIRASRRAGTAVILCAIAGCATKAAPPLVVGEVVTMSNSGTKPDVIIARMRESHSVIPLTGSQFAALKQQGVDDSVLDYMQQVYLHSERERQIKNCELGPPYMVLE